MATSDSQQFRRADPRSEVAENEIRGIASRGQGREQGPFILLDISDNGLRLWMPQHVATSEAIKLTIAKPFVVLLNTEVRWCAKIPDGDGFQVGLRVLDNLNRLEALHRALNDELSRLAGSPATSPATLPLR